MKQTTKSTTREFLSSYVGQPAHSLLNNNNKLIDQLPLDVLIAIFGYLDLRSLAVLSASCKTLYTAINDEYLKYKSYSLLVTNQLSIEVQKRSLKLLSSVNKYYANYRWKRKCYEERIFLRTREKFRPWLSLKNDGLFIGHGRDIHLYSRTDTGISRFPVQSYLGHSDDVGRFVVRGDMMISSSNDGTLCCWNTDTGKKLFSSSNVVGWNECVYVDWSDEILAAGFNLNGTVKFFALSDEGFAFRSQIKQNERVWSVALNEDGTSCSIGCAGYRSSPLKIYDLHKEAYTLSVPEKYATGAGVFQSMWESPHCVISGSYDTYVRVWDLRTGACVQSWSDPYDAAIYSLATDNNCTILAGTALHGRVTLWDKRLTHCVQTYYMAPSTDSGPVYSLDFDPSYLFVALESSLHVLNFSKVAKAGHS